MSITLALDKQSARRIDANGYLHVEPNPISKATVNPYKGSEIPGCEQLGLDPNKVYYLLRDPKELEKAAPTFNNLPILSKHIPVSSFDMDKPEVKALYVGSTGTDAEFDGTYLNNTLVLHAKSAIDDIQARKKHELSCAYRYQPDMTPGTFEGQHYDGIMRDIQGNHVALVTEGRAGHDVKVMDSKNGCANVVDYRKVSTALGLGATEKVRAVLFGIDSNPEGISQYSGGGHAEKAAEHAVKAKEAAAPTVNNRREAGANYRGSVNAQSDEGYNTSVSGSVTSKRAMKEGTTAKHDLAARVHTRAAKEHESLGNREAAAHHLAAAKEHRLASAEIAKGKDAAMDGSITKEVHGSDYETAEAAAKSAGTLAGMQPTPENRKQAARLSREAARLHRSAGFAKQAKYWDEVAAEFEKPAGGAKDSNPEGINQYNSAAAAAKSASNKAAKLSSTTSEHAKAAAAHTKAAEAHRNAAEKAKATGNNFPVRGHEEKAAYHEKAAELETRRSGGAKDSNPEGINQYSSAAGKAREATKNAAKLEKANAPRKDIQNAHLKAWTEHTRAAKVAPTEEKKAVHTAKASEHNSGYIKFGKPVHTSLGQIAPWHDSMPKDLSCQDSITKRDDVSAKSGEREYGDVQFADPKNNKYPLDTPEHVRAAASYFGMTKNRSQYGKEDQTKIDKRISAAERKFKLGKFAEGK
jgi:hypothetical protein